MKWNKLYEYPKSIRSTIKGERHYELGQEKLPSVTTILSATESEEKKQAIQRWKAKVGEKEAEVVKNTAATRGTAMHSYLEYHIAGQGLLDLTESGKGDYSCEIGVRDGMGSKIIMDNIKNNYLHIGVDPYANLNYQHYDSTGAYQFDYTDEMRDTMLNDLKPYRNAGKFHLANMTDTLFMCHPEYNEKKYAFIHFDGHI
jgi:hypothetical protein